MGVTITLPEPLTDQLAQQAHRLHISVDELAARLLGDALKTKLLDLPTPEEDVEFPTLEDEDFATLEEIVASIKAVPPNPAQIEVGGKVGDMAYLDYLLATPPQDTMTFNEWKNFWPQFEQGLKKLDILTQLLRI